MIILFIDDQEMRHTLVDRYLGKDHKIIHAYNYDDTTNYLNTNDIDVAMFDHDLMDFITREDGSKFERTGMDIISHMILTIPKGRWPKQAFVHSYNPKAEYMEKELVRAGIPTIRIQFSGQMLGVVESMLSKH